MAGTVRGRVDSYHNAGSSFLNAQQVFKVIYDFCSAHPNMTLIARHGGSGGTASNVNYHDQSNPFLPNAWFVFRMNDDTLENGTATAYAGSRTFPWYIYVQWGRSDQLAWNSSPATPSFIDGGSMGGSEGRVGVQYCIPVGSVDGTSEAPWNGGGSLGTNTKGTPVWRTTAGTPVGFTGSFVFPRSNNTGGSHSSNRENCSNILQTSSTSPVRFSVIADDDSIVFVSNPGDDLATWQVNYFGLFTPISGLTHPYPMVHIAENSFAASGFSPGTTYGTTSGSVRNGGIPMLSVADGVKGLVTGRYDEWFTTLNAPNRMYALERYDEWDIPVGMSESPTWYGYAGDVSFIREIYNTGPTDTSSGRTRAVIGNTAYAAPKITVPWDSTTSPRSTFTRDGVTF